MSKYMGFSANDKKTTKTTASASDDWDTDPNYVNDVSEKDQRWGSKEIGGKPKEVVNMNDLRSKVKASDDKAVKEDVKKPNYSYGYGGKFGVQTDRMDKSAHTNAVEEDKDANKNAYKPQGPLKDTKSAAKAFEDKATAAKTEPPKPTPKVGSGISSPSAIKNKFEAKPTPPAPSVAKPTPKATPPPRVPEPVKIPEPPKAPEPVFEPEPEPISEPILEPILEPVQIPPTDEWTEPEVPVAPAAPTDDWSDPNPVQGEVVQEEVVVVEETSPPEEQPAPTGVPAQARALYDFDAQDAEELGFKQGDIITIIQAVDDAWWQGEVDGKVGIFPVSYVEAL